MTPPRRSAWPPGDMTDQSWSGHLSLFVYFTTCSLVSPRSSHISHSLGWHPPLAPPNCPTAPTRSPEELSPALSVAEGSGSRCSHFTDGEVETQERRAQTRVTRGSLGCVLPSAGREDSAGAPCTLAGGWLAPAASQGAANLVSEGLQSPGQVWNCSPA